MLDTSDLGEVSIRNSPSWRRAGSLPEGADDGDSDTSSFRPSRLPPVRRPGHPFAGMCLMYRRFLIVFPLAWIWLWNVCGEAVPDEPFWQDVAVRIRTAPDLTNAVFRKVCVDKENGVYVLTDRGVARVWDDVLALDRSFRPLAGRIPKDITVSPAGDLYYLFDDAWLSNGQNGRPGGRLEPGVFDRIAVGPAGEVWFSGPGRVSGLGLPDEALPDPVKQARVIEVIPRRENGHPALIADGVLCYFDPAEERYVSPRAGATTAVAFAMESPEAAFLWAGSRQGLERQRMKNSAADPRAAGETALPWPEVNAIAVVDGGLWLGTTRGAVFKNLGGDSRYAIPVAPGIAAPEHRYYAGPRWLPSDDVLSLAVGPDGTVWVLTPAGLGGIAFRQMTLATKAEWFHRKIRSRNLRFGLTGERRLFAPGDLVNSEIVDTDNDGGWTSYYLGALAAEYAVTRGERVRKEAWESFGALERLQELSTVPGFSARTIERRGFKFSDTDRWREAEDPGWDWKGHTSSDEICSQTFAHAVMWEWVATNAVERARIATNYMRIVDHILDHDLYYVDVDGQPTLWGRWNPKYLNWFPHTIHDRRLNSAEITASLQLAFRMTGNPRYRTAAYELFDQHGYLTNILTSMREIAPTLGYVHQGNEMGDEWNHSDDELAFFTYWVLCRFAFTPDLQRQFLAMVQDHWEFERPERYPIWNFIYAACGGVDYDPAGAVWTLRGIPLDTINWPVRNSHRKDLHRPEPNFLGRELAELLPPGERLMARINTQPFILDAGDGLTDFPGDEYLLGYWLGRQVGAIGPAR